MNWNANEKQRLCIIVSRRSSIVITLTLVHSLLRNIPELAHFPVVLGLHAFVIYNLYLDMTQLHVKISSIEETSRAIDQHLHITMSGAECDHSESIQRNVDIEPSDLAWSAVDRWPLHFSIGFVSPNLYFVQCDSSIEILEVLKI